MKVLIGLSVLSVLSVLTVAFSSWSLPAVAADDVPESKVLQTIMGERLEVKATPKGDAEAAWTLNRGERFVVEQENGAWTQIKNERGEGWIPSVMMKEATPENLVPRELAVGNKKNSVEADANTETDESFGPAKKKHSGYKVNFKAVQELEKTRVSDKELQSFQGEGGLNKQ